ncbi:hypothetical protein PV10_03908 [Exophiala mesophila]|uniref:Metallo-beta-lactamase domain-containing protein n=1 Tax=Exophiala mesophila TaxID=212818 RepID=A0A0D1WTT6_EXOME|nr:uncharacterized protein PV10_03908 [Exophiala mesophila]KIV92635.1 hypothetical protein PV10_03908 [Exophiala mesophila]
MSYKQNSPLPDPTSESGFVKVTAFSTCQFQCPASFAIEGLPGTLFSDSYRFLIQHEATKTTLWFDFGVSSEPSIYPPHIQSAQQKIYNLIPGKNTPADDAKSVGVDPTDVKYIVASHAHWDHIFPGGKYHPNATILCGRGTLDWASSMWPQVKDSTFDAHVWDPKLRDLPVEELKSPQEAPEEYQQVGPFKNCRDFFGDGSFWIVDAPGHCPGNLAGLARVKDKTGKTKWVFFGGDCFHCHHFVHHPEAPFGKGVKVTPNDTFHDDHEKAREIIRQVADLKKGEGEDALIWIAHVDTLEGVWTMQ